MCKLGGTLIGIIVNLGDACVGNVKFGDAFIEEIVFCWEIRVYH